MESSSEEEEDSQKSTQSANLKVGGANLSKEVEIQIERQFQQLNKDVKNIADEITSTCDSTPKKSDIEKSTGVLITSLRKCNDLSKTVYETGSNRLVQMDADSLNLNIETAGHLIKSIKTDIVRFNLKTFADKCIAFLTPDSNLNSSFHVETDDDDDDDEDNDNYKNKRTCKKRMKKTLFIKTDDLINLSRDFSYIIQSTPKFHFLYGSFDTKELLPKVRTYIVRKTRKKDNTQTTKPTSVDAKNMSSEIDDVTSKAVDSIYNGIKRKFRCNGKKPIPFFDVVSNPDSFGKTVEDIFHSSFLIKDGLACLQVDKNKDMFIKPSNDNDDSVKEGNNQTILSFSMEDWRKIIQQPQASNS